MSSKYVSCSHIYVSGKLMLKYCSLAHPMLTYYFSQVVEVGGFLSVVSLLEDCSKAIQLL